MKNTLFLYHSAEAAYEGAATGGTGFLLAEHLESDPRYSILYAVTNWHVACRGASVIRINKRDGGVIVLDYGPEDWIFKAGAHDIAIAPILPSPDYDAVPIALTMLATDEHVAQHNIGPGEDVFMVGRFVDAVGHTTNQPALRFGNISMMPAPMKQENGATVPSYAIDMHSRSGFSGSPVFVFRKPGQDLGNGNLDMSDQFLLLLGIHWGQFPERWEIVTNPGAAAQEAGEISLNADSRYVSGLSGMTCVAPASAILDLLQHPKFRERMAGAERELEAMKAADQFQIAQADFTLPGGGRLTVVPKVPGVSSRGPH